MTNAIALENVSLSYASHKVLASFSMTLEQGSFSALLGPNGAGKSTIFNLIAGLLLPDQGVVRIVGHDTHQDMRQALSKVGMVFQQSALDAELSVRQNLRYFAGLHAVKNREQKIDELLSQFALEDRADVAVRDLNGGHKRRVEIARALLTEPSVLLLDEPTVGLDPTSKDIIVRHAHQLAKQGVCVLWITHLLDELYDDDDVLVLKYGQIEAQGTLSELGGVDQVMQSYAQKARPAL